MAWRPNLYGLTAVNEPGDVYLIHFERPFGHARHYLGFAHAGRLSRRIAAHRKGRGANLISKVNEAGIGWQVVRVWEGGGRKTERRLKNRGGSARHCPVCRGESNSLPIHEAA